MQNISFLMKFNIYTLNKEIINYMYVSRKISLLLLTFAVLVLLWYSILFSLQES